MVNMPIPRWEVQIRGDELDMAHLVRHFTSPQLTVRKDEQNGEFFLYTEEFDDCDSHHEVAAIAKSKISMLSGALKLFHRSKEALIDCGVCKLRMDGLRERFMQLHCIAQARMEVALKVSRVDSSGNVNELPSPPPRTVSIFNCAQTDEAIAKVMRLLGAPDAYSWVGLFRIIEVVEHDLFGEHETKKLVVGDGNNLARFKHSANSDEVAGDSARHGVRKNFGNRKPLKPMTIEEAIDYVHALLRRWISAKVV